MRRGERYTGLPPSPPFPSPLQTLLLWRSPFWFLSDLRQRYGPRFTVHALARPPLVFLSGLDDAKAVFAASPDILRPGEGGATIMPIVGERSFMLADGDLHWHGRTLLSPPFSQRAIEQHVLFVRDAAEREVASWPHDVPIALHDRLRGLTLRVILHTLLGRDVDHVPELHSRLLSMLTITAGTGLTLPISRTLPGGHSAWQRFQQDRAAVDTLLLAFIHARRNTTAASEDVLGTLVEGHDANGHPFSEEYVRDNLMSLILAGHETTAAQLAWAFQLLAHHPHVRDQLCSEIDTGTRRHYLQATVLEVLRHRPVFLFAIPRAVTSPIMIGDWTYTTPAHLLICIYLLHHDPAIFDAPDTFRPERFLDGRPGPSWLPWGGGRKRCPGRPLALLELETVLEAALSAVTIHPAATRPERPRWRSVIVTPHAGSRAILRDRRPRHVLNPAIDSLSV